MSIVIRPTAPLADRALLPADPGVALALAQALLEPPRMFNHNHGLWGYTGLAADGGQLTIQSTGIGGPSAAIVLDELIGLGLRRAVQVGTCTVIRTVDDLPRAEAGSAADAEAGPEAGLAVGLGLGDLVIADRATCGDGTSRALGCGSVVAADVELTAAIALASPATPRGVVASTDIAWGVGASPESAGAPGSAPAPGAPESAGAPGSAGALGSAGAPEPAATPGSASTRVVAHDMEAATLLTLGAVRGVAIACVLVVAKLVVDDRAERIDDDAMAAACERAGRLALSGLAARPG